MLGFDGGTVSWDLVLSNIWSEMTQVFDKVDIPFGGYSVRKNQMVDFDKFMSKYIGLEKDTKSIYGLSNHKSMINIFNALDTDNDGSVNLEEWVVGCDMMNTKLGASEQVDAAR